MFFSVTPHWFSHFFRNLVVTPRLIATWRLGPSGYQICTITKMISLGWWSRAAGLLDTLLTLIALAAARLVVAR